MASFPCKGWGRRRMTEVFISYSRTDRQVAEAAALHQRLLPTVTTR
jgi:hypothetical protein